MSSQYDEMVTGTGAIRPHWRGLMETVFSLTSEQLAEKLARASIQMADDEIVALPDAHPSAPAPSLDLLPLILPESEWETIADGLVQRARLLEMILADLYGPQRFIDEGLLPPYLIYGNPEFLRPLRHVEAPRGAPRLYFYATDLVRLPSGEWRVFADRTQAPSGAGYALHKRSVLARTFPEVFRSAPVRRLDSFMELWRSSLHAVGGSSPDTSQTALLTPGPYNDAYFEHVFLARALGITLVQSSDLTVRGDCVYLKTLGGLTKVDVIYRRVDGNFCDSLELREDSALGVAGLVQAARQQNVAVLNMPGVALVESSAFTPFLPNLAKRLLGQDLLLHAVTTWWCGQKGPLAEVREALDQFALHNVFDPDPVPVEPALLSKAKRADFEARLLGHPERFVARERIAPSLTPCLANDFAAHGGERLVPKPVVLRVMAVWHDGEWYALPGGSARIVTGDSIYRNMLRHSDAIKDTWVLSEHASDIHIPAATSIPSASARIERHEISLRSRTADDLFWLGRYVERLDSGLRQFVAALDRIVSGGLGARHQAELKRLAAALKRTGWIEPETATAPVYAAKFLDGIASAAEGKLPMRMCVDGIRRLTLASRDQLSLDMWRSLQRLTNTAEWHFDHSSREPDRLLESITILLEHIAAFSGLAAENMVRGAAWRFLDLGRRIERGVACSQAVGGVMMGPASQVEAGLRLSLELCDSINAYVTQYPAEIYYAQALAFVLADRSNPRALLYQLARISSHLQEQTDGRHSVETIGLTSLIEAVEKFPLEISHASDMEVHEEALFDLLDRAVACLMELSNSITRVFFTHIALARSTGLSGRPPAMPFSIPAPVSAEVKL